MVQELDTDVPTQADVRSGGVGPDAQRRVIRAARETVSDATTAAVVFGRVAVSPACCGAEYVDERV